MNKLLILLTLSFLLVSSIVFAGPMVPASQLHFYFKIDNQSSSHLYVSYILNNTTNEYAGVYSPNELTGGPTETAPVTSIEEWSFFAIKKIVLCDSVDKTICEQKPASPSQGCSTIDQMQRPLFIRGLAITVSNTGAITCQSTADPPTIKND